jgi:hypothetical protein
MADMLKEWEVDQQLGTLVADNATNNDTCGQELFQRLQPSLSPRDITHRRIRCYGHILNLVGRAFLYGEDSEAFEQESQLLEAADLYDDELRLWRRKGPIGKLHNIVKWVRSSPQRSDYFKASIKEVSDDSSEGFLLHEQSSFELQLVTNNDTRWNSTYLMIERALMKHHDIRAFLSKNEEEPDPQKRLPPEDFLLPDDWLLLAELKDVLEPLYEQTMRTQGRTRQGSHGALWEVLTGMEYLLERLEAWKVFFNDYEVSQEDTAISLSQQTRHSGRKRKAAALSDTEQYILLQFREEYSQPDLHSRLNGLSNPSRRYFRLLVING